MLLLVRLLFKIYYEFLIITKVIAYVITYYRIISILQYKPSKTVWLVILF